jgi:hypothetical protein
VDLDDVRFAQGGREASLIEEHLLAPLVAGQLGMENFHRHGSAENRVLGLPDDPHPALADLLAEAVVREGVARLQTVPLSAKFTLCARVYAGMAPKSIRLPWNWQP